MQNYRWQDDVILKIIKSKSRVLDLGCGTGKILQKLMEEKKITAQGVEIDIDKVHSCIEKKVPVMQLDLEEGFKFYDDKSFDYVILEETLQTLKNPIITLKEMLRIGKNCIITFPNFGHRDILKSLSTTGKMPMSKNLPYNWYDTPNIHLCTLKDIQDWIEENSLIVKEGYCFTDNQISKLSIDSNILAEDVLLIISTA